MKVENLFKKGFTEDCEVHLHRQKTIVTNIIESKVLGKRG